MKRFRAAWIAALASSAVVATGCSIADPDSSQLVLHYTGGPLSSQAFEYCKGAGERDTGGVGDFNFYYPAGQRTYVFRSDPADPAKKAEGADAPAIRVSTKNQIELLVSGGITFTLNPSCEPYTDLTGKLWPGGKLQKFHDTIGRQKNAYASDGGEPLPKGWSDTLDIYVGAPAERAMDNAGLLFDWQQLYSDTRSKDAWVAAVEEKLPALIAAQAGDDLFLVNNVQLDKPNVPVDIQGGLTGQEAAKLRASSADIDKAAAQSFPGGISAYIAYQTQQAVNKAIEAGKVQVIPVPQGSPIIVSPR